MSKRYFEKKAKEMGFNRPAPYIRKSDYVLPFAIILFFPILLLCQIILRYINTILVCRFEPYIGDLLVETNFISYLKKKKPQQKIIIFTSVSEIFKNNPNVYKIFKSKNKIKQGILLLFFRSAEKLKLNNIIYFNYPNDVYFYNTQKKEHLLCGLTKGRREFSDIASFPKKCEIYLDVFEEKAFRKKFSELPAKYYLILSELNSSQMLVKNWGFENMQKLVNGLPEINWVQVGTLKERKLNNIKLDLRGKTNLRELFYIVKNCAAVVCTEGMYTHLSSAFNKNCFTIFSGYHPIEISKYPKVIPIVKNPQVPCAYCWMQKCPFYTDPKCIKEISVNQVIKKIRKYNLLN